MNLVVSGFGRRWRRRDPWLVCVGWIFRLLLSLDRTRLTDQSVAALVPCEEVIMCLDGTGDTRATWIWMHHESDSIDVDSDQVFVLGDHTGGRHLRAGRYRRTPDSRPSNRKRGRA